MKPLLKSNPFATLFTVACVLIAIVGLGLAARTSVVNTRLHLQLEQINQRSEVLHQSKPPPTRETQDALATYQKEIEARVSTTRTALFPSDNPIPRFEGSAENFYFSVLETIESLRLLATEHEVLLNHADEAFGFALMQRSGQGPMDTLLQEYQERRVLLQLLVESLITSRPTEITEVEMEPAGVVAPPQMQAVEKDGSDDLFIVSSGRSLRGLGKVKTIGFRLQFQARTQTLRNWVNRLGQSGYPIVLRSVEVAPPEQGTSNNPRPKRKSSHEATGHPFSFLQTQSKGDSPGGTPTAAPVPLVKDNLSWYTVVLEYYQPEARSVANTDNP